MHHVWFSLGLMVMLLGGCASGGSNRSSGSPQSLRHVRILQIFDEIRIPIGAAKSEVQRLMPFPQEAPAPDSEPLLPFGSHPEKEEVIFTVAVDGLYQKVGGYPPFTARFFATFVEGRLTNFGLSLPDPHPRNWIIMKGEVYLREDSPAGISSVLLAQMEALKRTIEMKRKRAEPTG